MTAGIVMAKKMELFFILMIQSICRSLGLDGYLNTSQFLVGLLCRKEGKS